MKRLKTNRLNDRAYLWLEHHIDSFKTSIKRNLSKPLSFLFTVAMIAIALSIPLSLYILFTNVQQLTQQWDGDKQITLFLHDKIVLSQAQSLAKQIENNPQVLASRVLHKNQALNEFKQQMGFGSLITDLPTNPLPHLIIVEPDTSVTGIKNLQLLEEELTNLSQVQLVQFDLIWFQRLQAMLKVVSTVQWVVGIILLLAIALIIVNVIRWEVTSRHSEIEIIKLVGASDAYVRRPFLYSGLWLGLCGSMLAILIIIICSWLIQSTYKQFISLFDSEIELIFLSASAGLLIILLVSLLGIAASWIAVTHKLKQY